MSLKPKGRHAKEALTALGVSRKKKLGKFADGNGLYLKIDTSGAKRWIQRLTINGKRTDMGLGSVDSVPLEEARDLARENKREAKSGGDPLATRRQKQEIPTFSEAAHAVHQLHLPTWKNKKHADQWINTLTEYAFPHIGTKQVSRVGTSDILHVLTPIWTSKPETARRVRQRIGAVLKWSKAKGWRSDNPAENIASALPNLKDKKPQHQKSLPYEHVAGSITTIQNCNANLTTKLAIEFLILTATRSGEVREATWSEIAGDCWTISAERMKKPRAHRVPLSPRCLEILSEAKSLNSSSDYIFPNSKDKPYSDSTFSKLLRELNIGAVPHGFRSSFRVWASEQTGIPHQVCEFALAHVISDKAEAAYQRSDLFEKRRNLMDMWANYLKLQDSSSKIIEFKR